jgi:predicted dehydrogenase
MIKAAIVGCGKIADEHASLLAGLPGCSIVGVCDREELMARQLAERYGVGRHFIDVGAMLETVRPEVVHITTPPQSHFPIGVMCLESGAHVFMEKPFTVNTQEAERIIELAQRRNRRITVGHNHQFSHESVEMRELVKAGFLGGSPIHMESYFPYSLQDRYGQALLGDKDHWVRALPGKLLHNVISHGICKIAEYWPDSSPEIIAVGFTSPFLRSAGQDDIIDELRVVMHSTDRTTTAYFTFSSQISPKMFQFRLYGPENSLFIDHNQRIMIQLKKTDTLKSYLNHVIAPRTLAKQYLGNARRNIARFARNDFHVDHGRRQLVQKFYEAIRKEGPDPIPYREIVLTARIMDGIFEQTGTTV